MAETQSRIRCERLALLVSSLLGSAAYLIVFADYYSWWFWMPVAFVVLPISMIVAAVLMIGSETLVGRAFCLVMGSVFLWAGVAQEWRIESVLVGVELLVIGAATSQNSSGANLRT